MKKTSPLLLSVSMFGALACASIGNGAFAQNIQNAAKLAPVNIPFTKTVLDNGLTVIVHEDPKSPLVSVNIWYNVGSRDEKPGKTGYAHLFEHLMFNGSKHADFDFFKALNEMGATDFNGTTDPDKTNYFETVPKSSLDRLLWLEADRMAYLMETLSQQKLDEQRGVVKNEKRQGDNRPYSIGEYRMLTGLLPAGHPYRWSTIGSMADLNAASLTDLNNWFDEYYGAANAVLVLAGDVTADEGLGLAKKYFGHIRPGPIVSRVKEWVPQRTENVLDETVDEVSLAMVERTWAVPGMTNAASGSLYLAANILGGGETSWMHRELVEKRKIATEVSVQYQPHALLGFFYVTVMLQPGVDIQSAEQAIDEVFADFFTKGPSQDETNRAIKSIAVGFMNSQEVIGGFSGKGATLAEGEIFFGDPGAYKASMGWIEQAGPQSIKALEGDVFQTGYYQLITRPNGKFKAADLAIDLNKMPELGEFPQAHFPKIEMATLRNGMKLAFVERHEIPMIRMSLQFDAGRATDRLQNAGLATLTAAMMKEGTEHLSNKEILAKLDDLASQLNTYAGSDATSISMSTLKGNLDESLDLYADVLRNPAFSKESLEKLKQEKYTRLTQLMGNANSKIRYYLPELLFGASHPYGREYSGIGTKESLGHIQIGDVKAHYKTWLRPDNGVLLVVGDTTLDELLPVLEKKLGSWRAPKTPLPVKEFPKIAPKAASKHVYLIDKPGAAQTTISAAMIVPQNVAKKDASLTVMNQIIGGGFLSRINMTLREEKGWTYGTSSGADTKKQAMVWQVTAPVQSDKTAEAIAEIKKILSEYTASKPASDQEIKTALDGLTHSTVGDLEQSSSVLGSMSLYQSTGKPLNYFTILQKQYETVDKKAVHQIAKEVIDLEHLTWIIAGDLEIIEAGIKASNIGDITIIGTK